MVSHSYKLPSVSEEADVVGFGQSVKDDSNASSANAETGAPKDSMIDERESDGTGLISNEFQVEVSYQQRMLVLS